VPEPLVDEQIDVRTSRVRSRPDALKTRMARPQNPSTDHEPSPSEEPVPETTPTPGQDLDIGL
jgi:hypothetical protein